MAAGLVVLLIAVGVLFLLTRSGGGSPLAAIDTESLGVIDLRSGRIIAQVKVGNRPGAIAFGGGAVWVVNEEAGTVSKIDPESRDVVDSVEVGSDPEAIAVVTTPCGWPTAVMGR